MSTRILSLSPGRGLTAGDQLRACLAELRQALADRSTGGVLRQVIFFRSRDAAAGSRRRALRRILLREQGRPLPPTAFVAQAPAGGRAVALEAEFLPPGSRGLSVEARRAGGHAYRVLSGRGLRWVYAAGLGGDSSGGSAFRAMRAILAREGLGLGHVMREWNYIEDILGPRRYQAFNDLRCRQYRRARFPRGYPAATGIGMAAGGVSIDFIAAAPSRAQRRLPVSNPLQVDAYRYGPGVLAPEGGSPPIFERAQVLLGTRLGRVWVSGTAAIRGQRTVRGGAAAQTRCALAAVSRLVGLANLRSHGLPAGWRPAGLAALRVYVKRERDIPAVRRLCRARLPKASALYLRADICRDRLLIEIEGELALRR